jgi:hypothetical protein
MAGTSGGWPGFDAFDAIPRSSTKPSSAGKDSLLTISPVQYARTGACPGQRSVGEGSLVMNRFRW